MPAQTRRRRLQPIHLPGNGNETTTCAELVEALEQAGLEKLALVAVAGNGFVPGVTTSGEEVEACELTGSS
jgi:hypothetical protein